MKQRNVVLAVSLSILLAACGGSDGGGLASAPAPIPAPTPTPTPTPAAWQPPVSAPVTPIETFTALSVSTATQSGPGNAPYTATSSGSSGQVAIGRDASGGYSLTVPWLEYSTLGINAIARRFDFQGASQSPSGSGYAAGTYYVRQSQTSAAGYDHSLEVSQVANGHVNVATLITCNLPGAEGCTGSDWSRTFVVFGQSTPLAEIPLTGTAGYSGNFSALDTQGGAGLDGLIALQVDFASKGVTGSLNNISGWEGYTWNGSSGPVSDYTIVGQLGSGGFLVGNLTPSVNPSYGAGSWQASLFGPNAAAMGGALQFDASGGLYAPYTGTFTATKN
jgi:hypothetical protein